MFFIFCILGFVIFFCVFLFHVLCFVFCFSCGLVVFYCVLFFGMSGWSAFGGQLATTLVATIATINDIIFAKLSQVPVKLD